MSSLRLRYYQQGTLHTGPCKAPIVQCRKTSAFPIGSITWKFGDGCYVSHVKGPLLPVNPVSSGEPSGSKAGQSLLEADDPGSLNLDGNKSS